MTDLTSLTLVQYQAFALLLTPTSGLPPFEILPAVKHAASIADEACRLTQKYSPDVIVCLKSHSMSRSNVMFEALVVHQQGISSNGICGSRSFAIVPSRDHTHFAYRSELHQLTSPTTAPAFLDTLLDASQSLGSSVDDVGIYMSYIISSWRGIIKSSGGI